MFIINGLNCYELDAARFSLEFAAREAAAKEASKIVDLAAFRNRKKPRNPTSETAA